MLYKHYANVMKILFNKIFSPHSLYIFYSVTFLCFLCYHDIFVDRRLSHWLATILLPLVWLLLELIGVLHQLICWGLFGVVFSSVTCRCCRRSLFETLAIGVFHFIVDLFSCFKKVMFFLLFLHISIDSWLVRSCLHINPRNWGLLSDLLIAIVNCDSLFCNLSVLWVA